MIDSTLLQVFLLVNVFLIGAAFTIAVQHAYAHFRPHRPEDKKPTARLKETPLPPAVKERLLQESQTKFQNALDRSAVELQHDLQTTAAQLNKQLDKLGNEIVGDEMVRYKAAIDEMRKQAESTIGGAQTAITNHQAELEAKLAERRAELEAKLNDEIEAEKQQLIANIDTRLADAVASFLMETMQHNVDLGAQSAYLISMLEEHKAELTKRISDEA